MLNSDYGFSTSNSEYDTARRAQGSDYAKSQGLWVSTDTEYYGDSCWRLRSAGHYYRGTCYVYSSGFVSYDYGTYITNNGVRPAFYCNLKSVISQSENAEDWDNGVCSWAEDCSTATVTFTKKDGTATKTLDAAVTSEVTTPATCTVKGTTTYTATVTFADTEFTYTKEVQNINTIAHTWNSGEITKAANCVETGVKTYTCTVCKETKTEDIAIDSANHTGATEIKNKTCATCTTDGHTGDTYCIACGAKIADGETIKATGHTDANNDNCCDVCGANLNDAQSGCTHICHSKNAFLKFIWKIIRFFCKLFKVNQYC